MQASWPIQLSSYNHELRKRTVAPPRGAGGGRVPRLSSRRTPQWTLLDRGRRPGYSRQEPVRETVRRRRRALDRCGKRASTAIFSTSSTSTRALTTSAKPLTRRVIFCATPNPSAPPQVPCSQAEARYPGRRRETAPLLAPGPRHARRDLFARSRHHRQRFIGQACAITPPAITAPMTAAPAKAGPPCSAL